MSGSLKRFADFLRVDESLLKTAASASPESGVGERGAPPRSFTRRQGQFLAFLRWYHRLHRRSPAETDFVRYFRVTPPTVHSMIKKLDELGLVTREPGVPRSLRLAIAEDQVPELEETGGPAW